MRAKTRKGNPRWNSQCAHGKLHWAQWHQEQLIMRKTAYYANDLSTNAHTDIYSNDNARKILEGKHALAIPVRALRRIRIPAQNKCANGEKTPDPIACIDIIFGYQFANLFVPFFNAEKKIFIFCQFSNWKKMSPWQCAHRNQNDQNGSFKQIAHMGTLKKCAYGYISQCADKLCIIPRE